MMAVTVICSVTCDVCDREHRQERRNLRYPSDVDPISWIRAQAGRLGWSHPTEDVRKDLCPEHTIVYRNCDRLPVETRFPNV